MKPCVSVAGDVIPTRRLSLLPPPATALIKPKALPVRFTYDHRVWKTGLPVRSAVLKPHAGELVVGWVTTSESSLLYVFFFCVSQWHSGVSVGDMGEKSRD
ncbi:hypothetical protein ACN38_g2517 [Penicillium nordicum]|uniref:Uncharacterized protein n=1 Tax=Penicillium nordicum TaxID=229535 RepID=A0A0M9WIU3_9EURO|nr:hypothetical protein ACN38_g2517 [Penicillium nordicum]